MPSLAFRKASICSRFSFSASCTLVVNPQHATRSRLILCWKLPPPSGSSCIGKHLVQRQKYKFFYNPMLNHFGDHGETCGTFYFEGSEHLCYYWNLFDQVLLRPDLLNGFVPENVRILTSIGDSSLLRDGQPDKDTLSDHLPVTLELKF